MFRIQIGSRDGSRVFRKRKGRGWSNRNFSVAVQLGRSNILTKCSYSEPSVRVLCIPILPAADMEHGLKVVQSCQIRLSSHYFTNLIKTIYSFLFVHYKVDFLCSDYSVIRLQVCMSFTGQIMAIRKYDKTLSMPDVCNVDCSKQSKDAPYEILLENCSNNEK